MAKSLKCNQCGTLLANVRQIQDHSEATGHSDFAETEVIIRVKRCTECQKPCRTDAEQALHTKFTGHSTFIESSHEQEINTEAQMQEARNEAAEDQDEMKALLGLKKKKENPSPVAGPSGGSGQESSDHSMVAPSVDEEQVKELESMGFSTNRAIRAIYSTGGAGIESAVNWMMEHENDPEIDKPLMVTQASEDIASKMTPDERKRKAQELIKAAREKREREEKELAVLREKERIRAGKEMQLAQRKEQDSSHQKIAEQKRREKEQDQRDRERMRMLLDEDRRERRKKKGLPEELTEEEKAREAEKVAKEAKEQESKQKVFSYVKPVSVLDKQRSTLVSMKKTHMADESKWRTAANTLMKYIMNVGSNPAEEKFRNIKTSNAAFQQRVASAAGGVEFLELCGFKKTGDGELLCLARDDVSMDLLNGGIAALQDLLTNPFFGAL